MNSSGVDIARRVNSGALTASEAVETAISAANRDTNNAFTSVETDPVIVQNGGVLSGVPIAVKDLIDHAGRVNTAGSQFYRHRADTTAPALARLEQAGATVVGRTGLHEFAFGFSSENPWFGPVRNPWDASLSAGGSSGGSAAAVAAGIVPIALGTDTGGSVRVPAALCAVAGLKVTHGLIPTESVFPLVPSLDTVGAIAWSLEDLAVATGLMAGDDHIWSIGTPEASDVRLVIPTQWIGEAPLSDDVADAFEEFIGGVEENAISVERRRAPTLGPSPQNTALIAPEIAAVHGTWRREGRSYGDDVGQRIDLALDTPPAEVSSAEEWRRVLTAEMIEMTREGAILVTPTVGAMDKVIGIEKIGSVPHRTVLSWFTAPVNVSGLPALTVPVVGSGRRPSIQLIGSRGSERRLLDTARLLQNLSLLGHPTPITGATTGGSFE